MTMIDLSQENIDKHWASASSDIINVLENMEKLETWVLDEDESFKNAFETWAAKIGGDLTIDELEDSQDDFIKALAFMKSPKALYIVKCLEDEYPGFIVDTLASAVDGITTATEDDDVRHFVVHRDRLVGLYQLEMLSRFYSDDRATKIKVAVQEVVDSQGGLYGS